MAALRIRQGDKPQFLESLPKTHVLSWFVGIFAALRGRLQPTMVGFFSATFLRV